MITQTAHSPLAVKRSTGFGPESAERGSEIVGDAKRDRAKRDPFFGGPGSLLASENQAWGGRRESKRLSHNSACAAGERRTELGQDAGRPNSGHYLADRGRRPAKCVRCRQGCAGGYETASRWQRHWADRGRCQAREPERASIAIWFLCAARERRSIGGVGSRESAGWIDGSDPVDRHMLGRLLVPSSSPSPGTSLPAAGRVNLKLGPKSKGQR